MKDQIFKMTIINDYALPAIGILVSIVTLALSSVAIDASDKNAELVKYTSHTRNFSGLCIVLSIATLGLSVAAIKYKGTHLKLGAMSAAIFVMGLTSIGNAALLGQLVSRM